MNIDLFILKMLEKMIGVKAANALVIFIIISTCFCISAFLLFGMFCTVLYTYLNLTAHNILFLSIVIVFSAFITRLFFAGVPELVQMSW
ncbi:TPA: hypothetical protein ACLGO4_004792, partial [Salmonella enterica]